VRKQSKEERRKTVLEFGY